MKFWTEFLATSSSGSKFLVGELGGVAGVTAIHLFDMVRIQQQQPPPASGIVINRGSTGLKFEHIVSSQFLLSSSGSGLLDGECADIAAAFTHCQDLSSTSTALRISNFRSTKHIASIPEMRKVIGKPIADWLQMKVSQLIVMHTIICVSVPVICDVYLHLSICQSIYRLFDSYRE
jgi:hypothetical protein